MGTLALWLGRAAPYVKDALIVAASSLGGALLNEAFNAIDDPQAKAEAMADPEAARELILAQGITCPRRRRRRLVSADDMAAIQFIQTTFTGRTRRIALAKVLSRF